MRLPRYITFIIFTIFSLVVLFPIISMFLATFMNAGQITGSFLSGIFLNTRQWLLIKNSLFISFGVTFFSLILGVLLAFLLERTNLFGRGIFRLIYFIPLLIPSYIHAIVWTHIFIKNELIASIFKIHSLQGVIFVLTLSYFPFVTLIALSGLKSMDQHLEEASLIHHGQLKTLTSITFPLITPHIFAGAIFVFIFALVNFSVPDILRVNVYPVEIFIQFSAFFNEKAATLLSLPLIIIAFILITLQNNHMKRRSYMNLGGKKGKKNWCHLSPPVNTCFSLFYFMILASSILLPVIILYKVAGPFSNYVKGFSSSKGQIGYSILLAFLGALAAITLSFFISYAIERRSDWKRHIMELAAMLPFAVPAIVLGIGMIKVWNHSWTNLIYGSSMVIIFGYIARFIPFGIWSVQSNIKQIPVHLEEAGILYTRSWQRIFRKIIIPLCHPGLMAGFFIIFILSLGELATTLLIIPPGRSTLPIKIYNLMHYGAEHLVAALSLILIGLIILFSLIFFGLYRLSGLREIT